MSILGSLASLAVPGWAKWALMIGAPAIIIAGGMWWHSGQVAAVRAEGVAAERATWQAARAELLELRRQRADWSAARLAQRIDALPDHLQKGTDRVEIHWRDRPVRECLDADGVRAAEEARDIFRRAATAGTGDKPL